MPVLLLQSEELRRSDPAAQPLGAVVVAVLAAAAIGIAVRIRALRTPQPAAGRMPGDPALGALLMLGFIVAGALGATAAAGLLSAADPAHAHYMRLWQGVGKNLAEAALALLVIGSRLFVDGPRTQVSARSSVMEGVVAFLLTMPVVTAIALAMNAVAGLLGQPPAPEVTHETLQQLVAQQDPIFRVLTLAHVVILVPIAEEAGFRGLLQPAMRRAGLGGLGSAVATSALFTVVHWGALAPDGRLAGLAMLFVLGTILGILRDRTGGILAPIVLHALFNGANVAIAFL